MTNRTELYVKPNFVKELANGYPLILKEAITNETLVEEGSIIQLIDKQGNYIATGYYGEQNKGLGWVLTRKQSEEIDVAFFVKCLIRNSFL